MAKAEARRSLIGSKIGNYSILSILGEGGMGVVYLAEHPQIGKRVAIKVLHADHVARADAAQRAFLEARAVNEIRHPNVVDIIDCGVVEPGAGEPPIHYLLMEYLEGESLRALLRRGALPVDRATEIAIEVARALAAAHAKGIIHRDIKPENIFIVRESDAETIKVLDFGIAKLLDGREFGDPYNRLTQSGVTLGTPQYMAPEQLDAEDVDGRADVYALGIVLFEMVTGAAPFADETTARGVWRRMNELPTLTPEQRDAMPAGLEDLIMRTLDPDRIRRPEMADLARALVDPSKAELPAVAGDPHTVRIAKHASRPKLTRPTVQDAEAETQSAPTVDAMPPRSKLPLAVGALGIVALIAVAIILIASRNDRAVEPPNRPAQRDVTPPTSEIVTVTIESDPPGADVFVGDERWPRGRTPLRLPLVKGSPAVEVRIRLDGYAEVRRSVGTLRDDLWQNPLALHPAPTPDGKLRVARPPTRPTNRPTTRPTTVVTPRPPVDASVPVAPADATFRTGDNLLPPGKK